MVSKHIEQMKNEMDIVNESICQNILNDYIFVLGEKKVIDKFIDDTGFEMGRMMLNRKPVILTTKSQFHEVYLLYKCQELKDFLKEIDRPVVRHRWSAWDGAEIENGFDVFNANIDNIDNIDNFDKLVGLSIFNDGDTGFYYIIKYTIDSHEEMNKENVMIVVEDIFPTIHKTIKDLEKHLVTDIEKDIMSGELEVLNSKDDREMRRKRWSTQDKIYNSRIPLY